MRKLQNLSTFSRKQWRQQTNSWFRLLSGYYRVGQKWGHRLMTIILSNMKQFKKINGRFLGKFVGKWILKIPLHLDTALSVKIFLKTVKKFCKVTTKNVVVSCTFFLFHNYGHESLAHFFGQHVYAYTLHEPMFCADNTASIFQPYRYFIIVGNFAREPQSAKTGY